MRNDMKKVLTERPRRCCIKTYKNVRQRENRGDPDYLLSHRGIRKPYGWDTKEFNDHTGPLRRYLYSCVGRKWDDVWSEICQTTRGGTMSDDHLRQHVGFEFERQVVVVDDKVWAVSYGGRLREPWHLYVDPRDGLIYCHEDAPSPSIQPVIVDGMRYRRKDGILYPMGATYRDRNGRYPLKLIGGQKAMQIDGIWYWIDMAETPAPYDQSYYDHGKLKTRRIYSPGYDIILGGYVQEGRYHARKRQMASRDLHRHGLCNTR